MFESVAKAPQDIQIPSSIFGFVSSHSGLMHFRFEGAAAVFLIIVAAGAGVPALLKIVGVALRMPVWPLRGLGGLGAAARPMVTETGSLRDKGQERQQLLVER